MITFRFILITFHLIRHITHALMLSNNLTRSSLLAVLRQKRLLSTPSFAPSPLLKILFLGSDHFSIACLQAVLAATGLYESITVVTSGNKEARRGRKKEVVRREFGGG